MTIPKIPVSWGELIDKITILEIKTQRLPDDSARANVAAELVLLQEAAGGSMAQVASLATELKAVNARLWEIEDSIRGHERTNTFDADFIALARSVYRTNDLRSALKRQINQALGSALVEEKSYQSY